MAGGGDGIGSKAVDKIEEVIIKASGSEMILDQEIILLNLMNLNLMILNPQIMIVKLKLKKKCNIFLN